MTEDLPSASSIDPVLRVVIAWAKRRPDVLGVALVGSHARGTASRDSDIDLVIVTPMLEQFRTSQAWLHDIEWARTQSSVREWRDAQYGAAWSRHVFLADGPSIEFCFVAPGWTAVEPLDSGTRDVITGGCRILLDPERCLERLVSHVAGTYSRQMSHDHPG